MPDPAVEEIVARREGQPHQLIEALQDIQEACGWVSEEAMYAVSEGLTVPLMDVYSVAKFYRAFALEPRGRHIITVCQGTACHVRGAPRMMDLVRGFVGVEPGETTSDGLLTIESVNCLGACALGPVVVVDGACHHHMSPGKLRKLIRTLQQAAQGVACDAEANDV